MSDFEERLRRLEEIGGKLKDGGIPLDEATRLYEEGISLSKRLEKELQTMERRIEIVSSGSLESDAPPELQLFDGVESDHDSGDNEDGDDKDAGSR